MNNEYLISIIAGLSTAGIIYFFQYILGKPLEKYQLIVIIITLIISIFILLQFLKRKTISYIKEKIRPEVRQEETERLRPIIENEISEKLKEKYKQLLGLENLFSNFTVCETEILSTLKTSKKVKVFLQIGKTVLSGITNFYDYLEEAIHAESSIKILHAGLESPYLTQAIAQRRGSNYDEWVADIEHAIKKVHILSKKGKGSISARQHKEAYIWRLFIFDNVAYVQPYLYDRKNSNKAPVLKFIKYFDNNTIIDNSLYKLFEKYFDTKWEEYRPNQSSLSEIIKDEGKIAVSAIIRMAQFYVFAIPKRYILSNDKEIPFHGIGGKVGKNENLIDALQREAVEELGCELNIEDSTKTRYVTTGAELKPIQISDKPVPYCIYKRLRKSDINFYHQDILWLIGWQATLHVKLDVIKPKREIGALVILTGDMLRRTLYERLSYNDIKNSSDGSRVIISKSVKFDFNKIAVPSGLAILLANDIGSRFMKRL